MFCPNCGTNLPENSRFCNTCGMPQEISQAQTSLDPQNEATESLETTAAAQNAEVTSPHASLEFGTADVPEMPKKRKKTPIIVGSVLALVLAAAIAVGALWFFFGLGERVYVRVGMEEYDFYDTATNEHTDEFHFDEKGRVTGSTCYKSADYTDSGYEDYELESGITYEYDKNNILKGAVVEVNGDEVEVDYSYSDDGILKEAECHHQDRAFRATCDDEGRVVSVECIPDEGESWEMFAYEYDDEGNMTKRTYRGAEGLREILEYEDGLVVEEKHYMDGELWQHYLIEHDEHGNLIEVTAYQYTDGEKAVSYEEYERTYDKDGKILTESGWYEDYDGNRYEYELDIDWEEDTLAIVTCSGDLEIWGRHLSDGYVEWEYDEQGNKIRVSRYDADDTLIAEYKYTYMEMTKTEAARFYSNRWLNDLFDYHY